MFAALTFYRSKNLRATLERNGTPKILSASAKATTHIARANQFVTNRTSASLHSLASLAAKGKVADETMSESPTDSLTMNPHLETTDQ